MLETSPAMPSCRETESLQQAWVSSNGETQLLAMPLALAMTGECGLTS